MNNNCLLSVCLCIDLDSISKLTHHLKYLISFTSQHQASSATVTSRVDLWLLVVKYQHWYHQCLVQAFRSEEPDLSKSCRWFIEWFHSPISDSHDLVSVCCYMKCRFCGFVLYERRYFMLKF